MESRQYVDNLTEKNLLLKTELSTFLNQWQWEWFASLSLGGENRAIEFAERNLKRWRTRLSVMAHIQIAYIGIINHMPYSHLHLFMLGRNKNGQTLLSKSPTMWELQWPQDAKIEVINQKQGAIDYVVKKNMPEGKYELLIPYGVKHLKRLC